MQRLQIQALKLSKCYDAKVNLDKNAKDELLWWRKNLKLYNGKSVIFPPADLSISTDASTKGWGLHARGYQQVDTVTGETEGSHQHTRAEGSAFTHIDFYKN